MKYGRFFEIPSSSLLADELRFLSRAEVEFYGLDLKRHPGKVFDFFYRLPEPAPINLQYLADLGDHCFKAKFYNGNKAIYFESDTRFALIMPMQFAGVAPAWLPAEQPANLPEPTGVAV